MEFRNSGLGVEVRMGGVRVETEQAARRVSSMRVGDDVGLEGWGARGGVHGIAGVAVREQAET